MKQHFCPACLCGFYDYSPRLCRDCARMPRDIALGMRWDRFVAVWRRIGMVVW